MKKYNKNWGKVFQVRLSKQEYKRLKNFIKKFGVTHREFINTTYNELKGYKIIKDGFFWGSWKEYVYCHSEKWDKKIDENSKCEICGRGYVEHPPEDYNKKLERHHHDGYEEENGFKTHIVCRRCHNLCRRKEYKEIPFDKARLKIIEDFKFKEKQ
jgi:hypothetical protein